MSGATGLVKKSEIKNPIAIRRPTVGTRAFTRIDALALVATVLLMILAAPALASADRSKATRCLNNLRELILAWQNYADNHNGALVANVNLSPTLAWAKGYMTWDSNRDNTNILNLRHPTNALLGPYFTTTNNIHKCPADTFQSPLHRRLGWHRVRSVAMNVTVGTDSWFPSDSIYRSATNISDFLFPSPGESSVIFEEFLDHLGDTTTVPPARENQWGDLPGNLHNGGATLSFADGHAELHLWRSTPVRKNRVRYRSDGFFQYSSDQAVDISWMSYHSQRVSPQSY